MLRQRYQYRIGFFFNQLKNRESFISKADATEGTESTTTTTQTFFGRFYQKTNKQRLDELMKLAQLTGDHILREELLALILNLFQKNPQLLNLFINKPTQLTPIELALHHDHFTIASKMMEVGQSLGYKSKDLIRKPDLYSKLQHFLDIRKTPPLFLMR